uniref:WYL domain-containing protein n=1 Tax=Nocardia brasiliensis TaxID=37326 RepID=UPI0024539B56
AESLNSQGWGVPRSGPLAVRHAHPAGVAGRGAAQRARPRRARGVALLAPPGADELADTFRVRPDEVEPIDARTCLIRTAADSLEWTALRIAHLGLDFEVREPPEMRELLRDLGAKLARAAGNN